MKKLFVVFVLLCTTASCFADGAAAPPPPPPVSAPPPPAPTEDFASLFGAASADGLNGKYDQAIAELTKAMSLAKTNNQKAMAQLQIGNMYALEKEYPKARTSFDKVLAMDQVKPSVKAVTWEAYADSYSQEGKYHESRVAYNKILSMTDVPLSFTFFAQRKKIETYLSEKQYAKARTESGKLHTYKKSFPVAGLIADYYIGESYLGEGHFDIARKQFDKTQKFNQGKNTSLQYDELLLDIYQQKALLGIALSYFNQKQYDKAKEEYAKIVKMDRWGKFKDEAANEIKVIEKMQKKQ